MSQEEEVEREKRELLLLKRIRATAARPEEDADEAVAQTQVELRIDVVLLMMVDGSWVTGQSHRTLAESWNISTRRVDAYAAEAARLLRRYYREDEETRKDLLARHCQNMERLAKKAEDVGSKKGYRDAIEAHKVLAQLQGVLKHQVEHQIEDPRALFFKGWTREEKDHFAKTGQRPERLTKEDAGEG